MRQGGGREPDGIYEYVCAVKMRKRYNLATVSATAGFFFFTAIR